MTKEDAFEELKKLILILRDEGEKLKADAVFASSWQERQRVVDREIRRLNAEDTAWITKQYEEWFKSEIIPNLPEIDPKLKDKMLW